MVNKMKRNKMFICISTAEIYTIMVSAFLGNNNQDNNNDNSEDNDDCFCSC